jgi:2-aminoadipate transaminase
MTSLPNVQFINRPQLIDMTWGHPDPALLPAEAMQQAARAALADGGATALPYGAEQGPGRLIELLCAKMARSEGSAPNAARVAITGGISQAIDHLCTLLTRPGDIVLVEAPTYHLALRIMVDRGLRLVPVPADEEGMRLDALEEALANLASEGKRATLLYTIPTYSNPSGATMGVMRRMGLAGLAQTHGFTILEDDAYRDIWFENPPPFTIAALNPAAPVVRLACAWAG